MIARGTPVLVRLTYSKHARKRLRDRALTEADVAGVMGSPSRVEQGMGGCWITCGPIRGRSVAVVWKPLPGAVKHVITVYWEGED